jgi:hypothetical protein
MAVAVTSEATRAPPRGVRLDEVGAAARHRARRDSVGAVAGRVLALQRSARNEAVAAMLVQRGTFGSQIVLKYTF